MGLVYVGTLYVKYSINAAICLSVGKNDLLKGVEMLVTLVGFFFFQAEDCKRDLTVTGVQTCALPILTMKKNATLASGAAGLSDGGRPLGDWLLNVRTANVPAAHPAPAGVAWVGLLSTSTKMSFALS